MPLQISHPTSSLHLYRHILRESTYLPILCRPWITSHIQQRFRDCRFKKPSDRYVKQAHASLRYLRSVNAGHVKRLEHLCFLATGRVGKRRRILATKHLTSHTPVDTEELEQSRLKTMETMQMEDSPATSNATTKKTSIKHDWLENWSVDMIKALASSQLAQQNSDWPQNMRRALDPQELIRPGNCFGRPFRPKQVRNKLKKHWAAVLAQLLPPLPQGEWDHLASMVQGKPASTAEFRIPPRRPVARSPLDSRSLDTASDGEQWDWTEYVLKPTRMTERGSSRKHKTLSGKEDHDPRGHGRPIGIRVIGPRKLQRMYGRIWKMSPIMTKNSTKQKWSVTWGKHEQKISPATTRDLPFFQGVGSDGKVLPMAERSSTG